MNTAHGMPRASLLVALSGSCRKCLPFTKCGSPADHASARDAYQPDQPLALACRAAALCQPDQRSAYLLSISDNGFCRLSSPLLTLCRHCTAAHKVRCVASSFAVSLTYVLPHPSECSTSGGVASAGVPSELRRAVTYPGRCAHIECTPNASGS